MTSETTNTTLHNILRCVQSGTVLRHQSDTGQWALTINNQHVNDDEIALGISVLEAQKRLRWWPEYAATQKPSSPSAKAATVATPSATGTTKPSWVVGVGCGWSRRC